MNSDDSDQALMNFYELKTVHPQSIHDTFKSIDLPSDLDSKLQNIDECFSLLNEIINVDNDHDVVTANDDDDPLIGGSMMNQLFHKGIIKTEQDEERTKYFVSSKNFNSIGFLTRIHNKDSLSQLLGSLKFLESSIDKQSKELRKLIDSKFLKFVNSKNSIDDILIKFNNNLNESNNFKLTHLEKSVSNLNLNSSIAIKPIIEIKNKQTKINNLIEFINGKKYFFNLPSILNNYLITKDYDNLIHDYKNFKLMQKTYLYENDNQVNSIIDRVWEEVEVIIETYKKRIYKQLIAINFDQDIVKNGSTTTNLNSSKNFLNLVNKLYDIGIEDNPMLQFLTLQISNLQTEFMTRFQKFDEKFQMNKSKLNNTLTESDISYISKIHDEINNDDEDELFDSAMVLETWLLIHNFLEYFRNQFTIKFTKIWSNINYLKDFKFTSTLYNANEAQSKLNLDEYEFQSIKKTSQDLILLVCQTLLKFFSLNDDLEGIYGKSSPKKYGFLPPYTNSMSSIIYLEKISNNIATGLSHLASFGINNKTTELLRETNMKINVKIVEGICSVWMKDCDNFYELEKWDLQVNGITKFPKIVLNYQLFLINKLLALVMWVKLEHFEIKVVVHPSKKLLAGIKNKFIQSLEIIAQSLINAVENVNPDGSADNGNSNGSKDDGPFKKFHQQIPHLYKTNDIFKLLTVNNSRVIKDQVYPQLITKFDSNFKDNLKKENLQVFVLIDKFELKLFENYLSIQKSIIKSIIKKGFNDSWVTENKRTRKISNYIYEILIHLTILFTKITPISKESFTKIISQLQQTILKLILESTRELNKLNKYVSLQIQVDVYFIEKIFNGELKLNDYCLNLIDIIFKSVSSESVKISDIKEIVNSNLRDSETQFACFGN